MSHDIYTSLNKYLDDKVKFCLSCDKHNINDKCPKLLLCWDLTTRQLMWVILCRLPEKGRKEIEEIAEKMKERGGTGRKANRNESKETEEIKSFPPYPYLLQE